MSGILSITRWALVALAAVIFVACGEEPGDTTPRTPVPGTPGPTSTVPPALTPEPRVELRVGFINLHSPVSAGDDDGVAAQTFGERLAIVIAELKLLDPDIVAFTQASWTAETGSALSRLASELKMEFQYARARPWLPDQPKEESDALANSHGYDEGVLILSKEPILSAERAWIGWKDRDEGHGYVALHVAVGGPDPVGVIDIYVADLEGISEDDAGTATRNLITFVLETRGDGPMVLAGNLAIEQHSGLMALYHEAGLLDAVHETRGELAVATCCRSGVVDPESVLTERSDYIITNGWLPSQVQYFAYLPVRRPDGTLLYASTRNGMLAVFPLASAGDGTAAGVAGSRD